MVDYSQWKKEVIFTRGATSSNIDNSKGKGAQFYIRYETEQIESGKTQVRWALFKGLETDRENKVKFFWNLKLFFTSDYKITYTEEEIGEDGLVYNPSRVTNEDASKHPHIKFRDEYNTEPTTTGSFVIEHNSEGQGNFKVQAIAAIYTKTYSTGNVRTIELDNNSPQTPCYWASGATVTIEEDYVAPGGYFTITWSGATAGIGNSIDNYNVSYAVNSVTQTETTVSLPESSCRFQLSKDAPRGAKITAQVGIKGSATEGLVYKTGGSSIVNPAITQVDFVDYSGKDTNNIFSVKLEKIKIQMKKAVKPTNQPIQYRCCWNGGRNQTVSKSSLFDIPLQQGSWTFEPGQAETFYLYVQDGVENFPEGGVALTLTRNEGFGQDAVSLTYENYIFTPRFPDNDGNIATLELEGHLSQTVSNNQSIDIRSLLNEKMTSEQEFSGLKGMLTCSDGVDKASTSVEKIGFQVPKITVQGTKLAGYFVGDNKDTVTVSIEKDKENWIYSGIDKIEPGGQLKQIKMRGKGSDDSTEFYVEASNTITAIKKLELTFTVPEGRYRPYTERPSLVASPPTENWAAYGLDNPPKTLEFWLGKKRDQMQVGSYQEWSNDSQIAYSFAIVENAPYQPHYLIAEGYDTGDEPEIRYSYKTIYNTDMEHNTGSFVYLDFDEPPRIQPIGALRAYVLGDDQRPNTPLEAWEYLKEDVELFTNDIIISFGRLPSVYLESSIDGINWTRLLRADVTNLSVGDGPSRYNCLYDSYGLDGTVKLGEISEDSKCYLRLLVETYPGKTCVINTGGPYSFKKHQSPLLSSAKAEYDSEQGEIIMTYSIADEGASKISSYEVYATIDSNELQGDSSKLGEATFKISFGDNETFKTLEPELITYLDAVCKYEGKTYHDFETSKHSPGMPSIICYNVSPTVAYRSNYLGINTKSPAGDSVLLDINARENQRVIYFRYANGNDASIDLATKGLSGFVVDAGSWDGAPGGIIPSNPDVPAGLAQIAYTGEFSDLQQQGTIEIIISGGGAPV